MPEHVILKKPFRPDPREATKLQPFQIDMNWEAESVILRFKDPDSGVPQIVSYNGAEAIACLAALNQPPTGSDNNKTLQRRAMERVLSDKKLDGVITGSP